MRITTVKTVTLVVVLALALAGATATAQQLPLEPPHKDFGQVVWPVYEGWYDNPDGTFTFLVGYFNPNKEQTFDLPVGESNFFAPGAPDRGQPTHFDSTRGWAVFGVTVGPEYANKAKELTWTLVTNDQTATIPMHTDPGWYVEPFKDAANGNRPPTLRFAEEGPAFEGPPSGIAASYSAVANQPMTLTLWADDAKPAGYDSTVTTSRQEALQRPGLVLRWLKLQGPGDVAFDEKRQTFQESTQNPETTVTFSAPGDYVIRVEALDETGSGGGGSQCCWTSAHLRVTVTGAASASTTGE